MRLPRARFTLRWMMLAVAGVGTILGASIELRRRHERFSRLAELHEASRRQALFVSGRGLHLIRGQFRPPVNFSNALGEDVTDWSEARFKWHRQLGKKYRRAASRPWLPVEPDPPEPR